MNIVENVKGHLIVVRDEKEIGKQKGPEQIRFDPSLPFTFFLEEFKHENLF